MVTKKVTKKAVKKRPAPASIAATIRFKDEPERAYIQRAASKVGVSMNDFLIKAATSASRAVLARGTKVQLPGMDAAAETNFHDDFK